VVQLVPTVVDEISTEVARRAARLQQQSLSFLYASAADLKGHGIK